MKTKLLLLLAASLSISCSMKVNQTPVKKPSNKINNIIMVVADGMGPVYTSAYRYYADNPDTPEIEESVFDKHYVGSATTYPAPISGYITDSAAAATALASGVKTYNDAIGVDINKNPVETVLERAKSLNMKTGIVVTSQINHATPASYLSHNIHRRNYNEIADSYLDNGIKADVYLGGGWKYFIREDRNLVNEFVEQGFQYTDNFTELSKMSNDKPLLGLFGHKGLPWAIDDVDPLRLKTMTNVALNKLENSEGFFLLVEASQVDWAGHGKDILAAMHEMNDLAETIRLLETYVDKNPDTLVILTADHSTGGLSLGRETKKNNTKVKGGYIWDPELLRQMKRSPEAFARTFSKKALSISEINNLLGFELTKDEYNQILLAKDKGLSLLKNYELKKSQSNEKINKPNLTRIIAKPLKNIIDLRTNTGWGGTSNSATHTAVDVPVFVIGQGKERFSGSIDNTDIAKEIFKLLEER